MGEEVETTDPSKKAEVAAVASFDPTKKKKKKKVVVHHDHVEEGQASTSTTLNNDDDSLDYTYGELLGRVSNMVRENNPNMVVSSGGERKMAKLTLRPPEVLREGTKKMVLVNLMDYCKKMHREPEHVMSFLLVELGTTGSLDGQQRLVAKGRFNPSKFEGILRSYVNEYVSCIACRSCKTILSKEENRLMFVRCEDCGSARTVAPINKGVFLAQVQHRRNSRPRGS